MPKLSPAQAVEIAELREQGWSYDRLAERFGVSASAIHYRCLRQGARSPRSHRDRYAGPAVIKASDGRTQRRFTPEEDARLLALDANGTSFKAMARELGRPNTSVRIRLMALALHEDQA